MTVVETATEMNRGRQRWRKIVSGALSAAAFRAISILGTLFTVPIVIHELGNLQFGTLVLITQLSTLFVFADMGLGNGLISALSGSLATGDHGRAQSLISSTWFLLIGVAAIGSILFSTLVAWVPWDKALGVDGLPEAEVRDAVAVFGAFFIVGLPVSIGQKIHLARQEGLQAGAWQAFGAVLTILATVACASSSATLPWYVAAAVGGGVTAGIANCLWLFHREPAMRPKLQLVRAPVLKLIFRSGALFLVLGMAGAVAYQTDALIISHLLGGSEVSNYNLAMRLFSIPTLALSFILAPMWPAFSNAFALNDYVWARRAMLHAISIGALINIPSALVLTIFGARLIEVWIGRAVTIPLLLLASFGLWTAANAVQGPLAMWLNGAHVVKFQVVCAVVMAIVNLGLSVTLTRNVGIAGPVLGTLIAQTFCITIPSLIYVSRMWRP